jgi:hypothetical protein
MHLGLCIDESNLFRSFIAPYSCYVVILAVYNLPLEMYMRSKFMFLSTVIPDPYSSSRNIDVCLQPLIDELNQLWSFRTLTYDVSRK